VILDNIGLHNFGPYLGKHTVELTPPADDKPVTLIGALNGGGKTSLLDAIQLCFYGKMASCSKRGTQRYDDYLRSTIHRRADPEGGAEVSVSFRHRSGGDEHRYQALRRWGSTGKGRREDLEVSIDGYFDGAMSDTWAEHVDRFLPARLAPLFFFDGEQIESLANPGQAAGALKTAIHSLLGLDLVDQLQQDLQALERRKRKSAAETKEERDALQAQEAALNRSEGEIDLATQHIGECRIEIDRARYELEQVELRFQEQGGGLFENRRGLEREREHLQERIAERQARVRELIAGPAPFLLIPDLLADTLQQHERELHAEHSQMLAEALSARDEELLAVLKQSKASAAAIKRAKAHLEADRKEREAESQVERYLEMGVQAGHQLRALVDQVLPATKQEGQQLLAAIERDEHELAMVERKLAAIPDEASIAALLKERAAAQHRVAELDAKLAQLQEHREATIRDRDRAQRELDQLLRSTKTSQLEAEDLRRFCQHAGKARGTLDEFRAAIVERHVTRIQDLVLESFRHLMRKQGLVHALRIDPDQFTLELSNAEGVEIRPGDLSAGERQLLAVSLLWGLARASGRPLPVIIDTPLGRLDGQHREHLVARYFPCASHQVILLSTDEEIDEDLYDSLRPRIGRSYVLEHDDALDGSRIREGYFWEAVV